MGNYTDKSDKDFKYVIPKAKSIVVKEVISDNISLAELKQTAETGNETTSPSVNIEKPAADTPVIASKSKTKLSVSKTRVVSPLKIKASPMPPPPHSDVVLPIVYSPVTLGEGDSALLMSTLELCLPGSLLDESLRRILELNDVKVFAILSALMSIYIYILKYR